MKHRILALSVALAVSAASLSGCGSGNAQALVFTLSSTDLASGTFANQFVLNGFGCAGGNTSPALQWFNPPSGTQSFSLQVYDPDAPTGSGFWHWAVYDIPPTETGLAQGAGNSPGTLPAGAYGGNTDFFDTGATGGNGNYGGPCPPVGDAPHRYIFTLFALDVPNVDAAAGIPKTGTAGLFGFALGRAGLGAHVLGKASFTATYGR
jgi:Raf kinase inhibitor-like YbhB/YbcL family protein